MDERCIRQNLFMRTANTVCTYGAAHRCTTDKRSIRYGLLPGCCSLRSVLLWVVWFLHQCCQRVERQLSLSGTGALQFLSFEELADADGGSHEQRVLSPRSEPPLLRTDCLRPPRHPVCFCCCTEAAEPRPSLELLLHGPPRRDVPLEVIL